MRRGGVDCCIHRAFNSKLHEGILWSCGGQMADGTARLQERGGNRVGRPATFFGCVRLLCETDTSSFAGSPT